MATPIHMQKARDLRTLLILIQMCEENFNSFCIECYFTSENVCDKI
jgi:hypothetical protein